MDLGDSESKLVSEENHDAVDINGDDEVLVQDDFSKDLD
jgi:hypothetical protein